MSDRGNNRAFPGNRPAHNAGITIREHYASLAMQGLLAGDHDGTWRPGNLAVFAKECADALIEELSK